MIRVFARRTNMSPTDSLAFYDEPPLFPVPEGPVKVSCTFTEDIPRAKRLARAWEKRCGDVELGGPAFGHPGGEFVPGRFLKDGAVFTSRGCNNKCWYCLVPPREGNIRELNIKEGWNILDSNLLQCSRKHIEDVFAMLQKQPRKARFTGGIEARRLEDWHVQLLTELKPERIYFAYDKPKDYEPLRIAAGKIKQTGLKYWNTGVYVLIGYKNDTLEKAEQRLIQVCELGLMPFAMLHQKNTEWKKFHREWANPYIVAAKLKQCSK